MTATSHLVAGMDLAALKNFVSMTLAEDLGQGGDVTSAVTVPSNESGIVIVLRTFARVYKDDALAAILENV